MDWENSPPFGIGNKDALLEKLQSECVNQLAPINLEAVIAKQRNEDAFGAWKEDLNRSKVGSFRNNSISPDHVKAAAHITYWIRRASPIIDVRSIKSGSMYCEKETLAIELNRDVEDDSVVKELTPSQADFQANRLRAFAYCNELLAFTFGFGLAKAYEEQKLLENGSPKKIATPEGKYIEDLCYFFKFKSVSPHSIDLIYRALLKNYV